MTDAAFLDATAQAELVRSGEVNPQELVDAAITRIEKLNGALNAVIRDRFDLARAEAAGDLPDGPFRGVPMVLKDHDGELGGEPVYHGMRALAEAGFIADHDSFLMQRFRAAGFVFVGKTNTPELGLMPTTEPELYGPTHNPWDTSRSPGGSSGGSAAAVASGMVPVGHGGDGGGSIRIPASACGLVGLKPSRGRVPNGPGEEDPWSGLISRHVVSRSVRDAAAILDAVAGPELGDPYWAPPPERPFRDEVGADPGQLRVGFATVSPLSPVAPECVAAAEHTARLLEQAGHHVEEAAPAKIAEDLSVLEHFIVLLAAWTKADLETYGARAFREITSKDVEPVTAFYADSAPMHSAAQYIHAIEGLKRYAREVIRWWADWDLLLTPTLASVPPKLGELIPEGDDVLDAVMRQTGMAAFTGVFNATGQPAVSLPMSWTDDGLPVGAQLVAAPAREDVLIRVAAQLEQAAPWADRRPPVAA